MGRVTVTATDAASHTATATADYTITGTPPPGATLLGRSSSPNNHGPLTQCDVVRVYRYGSEVDQQLAESGATALFMTDEQSVQTGSQLDAVLTSLFNRHPDVLVYCMPDNEITADQLSSSQAQAHTAKLAAWRQVVDDWPNAYLGINLTTYGVRVGRHTILAPCAEYLDIIISSCYNPGRTKSPPVWDPYSYLDEVLDVTRAWGVPRFGVGEFGNPVNPSDPNKRPTYAAGALQYIAAGCADRGLEFTGACWWDQQKSGGPNNRLDTDNPRTAQAWKDALT